MYTRDSLLDMHRRGHISLAKVLDHCAQFTAEEIDRELPCFEAGTLLRRLYHIIETEQYWMDVARGRTEFVDVPHVGYPTIASLLTLREEVAAATEAYLANTSETELNTVRTVTVWEGEQRELMPVHIFLRTLTHIYHHLGQVLVMCRELGRPIDGMDFPIRPEV